MEADQVTERDKAIICAYYGMRKVADITAEHQISEEDVAKVVTSGWMPDSLRAHRNKAVIEALRDGQEVATVARTFYISETLVALIGRNADVLNNHRKVRARNKRIAERIRQGRKRPEIAAEFGVDPVTVSRVAREFGLTIEPAPRRPVDVEPDTATAVTDVDPLANVS